MVELIQLFVLCCGCKAGITMEMFQTEDPSDVIRALTENFAEVRPQAVSFVCSHEGVCCVIAYRRVGTTLSYCMATRSSK